MSLIHCKTYKCVVQLFLFYFLQNVAKVLNLCRNCSFDLCKDAHISKLGCLGIDAINYSTAACNPGPYLQNTTTYNYIYISLWIRPPKQPVKGHCNESDLFCSLLGAKVCFILVSRGGLRAACRLVQELPQALSVVSHGAVVVPKCWTVVRRYGLWTPFKQVAVLSSY